MSNFELFKVRNLEDNCSNIYSKCTCTSILTLNNNPFDICDVILVQDVNDTPLLIHNDFDKIAKYAKKLHLTIVKTQLYRGFTPSLPRRYITAYNVKQSLILFTPANYTTCALVSDEELKLIFIMKDHIRHVYVNDLKTESTYQQFGVSLIDDMLHILHLPTGHSVDIFLK